MNMEHPIDRIWEEDLLCLLDEDRGVDEVFHRVQQAAKNLDFDYCAYGIRLVWPVTKPKVYTFNNYPSSWQSRYEEQGYLHVDPTVQHCSRTQAPLVWGDEIFASVRDFWGDAQSSGLRFGWAQSNLDAHGGGGMLTLARSQGRLTQEEVQAKATRMRWLVNIAHQCIKRALTPQLGAPMSRSLTPREVEVLKWTADGKTSSEIADILIVSIDTVNFHVKNAVTKLAVANKTAAVVRAYMLGLLA